MECGDRTTYAVTNEGEIYSWGLGEQVRLNSCSFDCVVVYDSVCITACVPKITTDRQDDFLKTVLISQSVHVFFLFLLPELGPRCFCQGQLGHTESVRKRGEETKEGSNDQVLHHIVAENVSYPKQMKMMSAKSMGLRKGSGTGNGGNGGSGNGSGSGSGNGNGNGNGDSKSSTSSSSSAAAASTVPTEDDDKKHKAQRDDPHDDRAEAHHAALLRAKGNTRLFSCLKNCAWYRSKSTKHLAHD